MNNDYTDKFSNIIHVERPISVTELSERFFSIFPKKCK